MVFERMEGGGRGGYLKSWFINLSVIRSLKSGGKDVRKVLTL